MSNNTKNLYEINAKSLKAFCWQVLKTQKTPDLVRLVAGETAHVNFCRHITKDDAQCQQWFAAFCQENRINADKIRKRMRPVAAALGMHKPVDYYEILGVSRDADEHAIKQAYRKKAKILHPDKRVGAQKDSVEFVKLHAAYMHLSDPGLRMLHHRSNHNTGDWIERSKAPEQSRIISGFGSFLSWICILIGAMLLIAYSFDIYENQWFQFAASQTPSAPLIEAPVAIKIKTGEFPHSNFKEADFSAGDALPPIAGRGVANHAKTNHKALPEDTAVNFAKAKNANFPIREAVKAAARDAKVSPTKNVLSVKATMRPADKNKP